MPMYLPRCYRASTCYLDPGMQCDTRIKVERKQNKIRFIRKIILQELIWPRGKMHKYPVIRISYSNQHCRYRIKMELWFHLPICKLRIIQFSWLVNTFNNYSNYRVLWYMTLLMINLHLKTLSSPLPFHSAKRTWTVRTTFRETRPDVWYNLIP